LHLPDEVPGHSLGIPRFLMLRISENAVMAKFICEPKALIQKAQDRQRGSKISGRPGKRGSKERTRTARTL